MSLLAVLNDAAQEQLAEELRTRPPEEWELMRDTAWTPSDGISTEDAMWFERLGASHVARHSSVVARFFRFVSDTGYYLDRSKLLLYPTYERVPIRTS